MQLMRLSPRLPMDLVLSMKGGENIFATYLPHSQMFPTQTSGDMIFRRAAIDALKRVPGVGNRALDKIRELPPATTEQDWIPVNEEMPPLRHDVWLTVFFHEKWNVTEGYRQDGEFMFWNHGRLESALDEEKRVTAWKPKSKPYQPDAK